MFYLYIYFLIFAFLLQFAKRFRILDKNFLGRSNCDRMLWKLFGCSNYDMRLYAENLHGEHACRFYSNKFAIANMNRERGDRKSVGVEIWRNIFKKKIWWFNLYISWEVNFFFFAISSSSVSLCLIISSICYLFEVINSLLLVYFNIIYCEEALFKDTFSFYQMRINFFLDNNDILNR